MSEAGIVPFGHPRRRRPRPPTMYAQAVGRADSRTSAAAVAEVPAPAPEPIPLQQNGGTVEAQADPIGVATETRLKLVGGGFSPLPLFGKEPPIYGKNSSTKASLAGPTSEPSRPR
jgi:hypothetical protein